MADKPNFLFIMADQLRWDYLGYMGAEFVDTPNIDAIAKQGQVFTHCFSNAPLCAPARIGLAAGMRPHNIGAVGNRDRLPLDIPTYYRRLRDHGYRVGCVGKLDLAKPDRYNGPTGDRPCTFAWGFTHPVECEGKMHAGSDFGRPHGPYTKFLEERGELAEFRDDYSKRANEGWVLAMEDSPLPSESFEDIYIGQRSAQWLEELPNDFPWHLFVSFVGPHDPFDPPSEYAEQFRDAAMPEPIPCTTDGRPQYIQEKQAKFPAEADVVLTAQRQYCAAIKAIDDSVGRIMEALESRGERDNTYVIIGSDHGEMLYDHGLWTKTYAYESSWRVPLVVAGPDVAPARQDTLVELIDVGETICDLAGLSTPDEINAKSLAPVLCGTATEHRSEVLGVLAAWRALRTERYKLVDNIDDVTELYDMTADPAEAHNLASERPELVAELKQRLDIQFAG